MKKTFPIILPWFLFSCAPIVTNPGSTIQRPPYSSQHSSTKDTTTRPKLKQLPNGHYEVLENWPVTVSNRSFLIPQGYVSNGITAPQSIKVLLGDHINAPTTWSAIFHDWCFTQPTITRAQADSYFIQLMQNYKINPNKIQLMGTAVKTYSIYKGF